MLPDTKWIYVCVSLASTGDPHDKKKNCGSLFAFLYYGKLVISMNILAVQYNVKDMRPKGFLRLN